MDLAGSFCTFWGAFQPSIQLQHKKAFIEDSEGQSNKFNKCK